MTNINNILFFILCIIMHWICQSEANLRTIQDEELMDLIRTNTYVVALFTSKDSEQCRSFENLLDKIEEELTNSLDAKVIKVVNSQLTRLYSPTKEPVLVFFRHGIPLLYHGHLNDDLIIHTFISNKEPVVKELNDETFEHLTQAATGATTGDWFVMFYAPNCVDCQRLQARWEAVAAHLKNRVNLARVNKAQDGIATARRFGVTSAPTFILFRHGKMYRYQIQKYDIESFVAFVQDWYKNVKAERVPHPKTPFDKLIDIAVDMFKENPLLWLSVGFLPIWLIVVLCIFNVYKKQTASKQKRASVKTEKKKE